MSNTANNTKKKNSVSEGNNAAGGTKGKKSSTAKADKKVPAKTAENKKENKKAPQSKEGVSGGSNKAKADKPLKVIFLGGVGEIGKNFTALEYDNDIMIIDCGSAFPTPDMPGVDLVIPDMAYLETNKDKVRGLVLTHGHEDHIGAVPYFLKNINVPVYGSKITLALVETKLKEHNLSSVRMNIVKPGSVIKLGCFETEFINVSHSIAGSCALCISTPVGYVYHSGDFKVDFTPLGDNVTDLQRIGQIGQRGVLLMLCESTNIERQGYSISERRVGESFNNIFEDNTERRIVIATFASNIHRLQQILDLAVRYKRKVAFFGRSLCNVVAAISQIGELRYPAGLVVDIDNIGNVPDKNLVVITTGSQGEPMSGLTRMASDVTKLKLGYNDTVIISSSPIPGNERMIYTVINNLYRHGCRVIYESLADVHVSGHAYQEELKLIHTLVKPKFFIPVHGEHRHQKRHMELAGKLGITAQRMLCPDIGNQILVFKNEMKFGDNVPSGSLFVDGLGIGDVGTTILRDRKHLAENGIMMVVVTLEKGSGIVDGIEISSKGFVYGEEGDNLLEQAKAEIIKIGDSSDLKEMEDLTAYKNQIRKVLRNFFAKSIGRDPMVFPIVIEV